jgi:serine/threonine-protein kinase RsbW
MQPENAAPRAGSPTSRPPPPAAGSDADSRGAARRRRADALRHALLAAASRVSGGKAESARRALGARIRGSGGVPARVDAGDRLKVSLPLDGRGPRAARTVVEGLRGRIAPSVVDDAQLVVSELVTNAVRHSGAPAGGVVVLCVELTGTTVRLEVGDPGSGGVIAPRTPDLDHGGGFGLHVVRELSERWGLEQVAAGGTRVWADIPRVPPAAPRSARHGAAAREVSRNGNGASG